ncbi:hypothetical protein EVAR_89971_1 [Eumeta japonica]|uniref:Uncharacterized protein n=1 Tax=Eumeta variegata TaxID=151549 RepID=A0A4C2ACM3_EUMVA|nr:hypothetical protein EVAR_89971_1 [Eumeta japonica]
MTVTGDSGYHRLVRLRRFWVPPVGCGGEDLVLGKIVGSPNMPRSRWYQFTNSQACLESVETSTAVPGRSTSTALNDILGCRGSAAKYVQLIFLDISELSNAVAHGFDGLRVGSRLTYELLTDYFTDRGGVPRWHRSRGRGPMGCQDVLGCVVERAVGRLASSSRSLPGPMRDGGFGGGVIVPPDRAAAAQALMTLDWAA